MSETKVDAVLRHVDSMPPLPTTVIKIIEIANDPRSSVYDMDKVVSMDTVFSAKLLKMVNSSYFGLRDKITTTSRAIAHLGMNTVKNLVLCAVVMKSMSDKVRASGFDMEGFWKHSMGCSIAAKMIAGRMNFSIHETEDFALSGLLHDIGKLVFINFLPKDYKKVAAYASKHNVSYLAAERQNLSPDSVMSIKMDEAGEVPYVSAVERKLDHSYIGRHLAEKWNFPDIMTDVIAYHHFPWECRNPYTQKAVHAVFIADVFAKANGLGFNGDSYVPLVRKETWDILGFNYVELSNMKTFWLNEVEGAKDFLEVR